MQLVHFGDWPLRAKAAVLLAAASVVPLALAAFKDVHESRLQLLASTELQLQARADQLASKLDDFQRALQASAERLARSPAVVRLCQATPAERARSEPEAAVILEEWRSSIPEIGGISVLDASGAVLFDTEPSRLGQELSFRSSVRAALHDDRLVSEVFVDPSDVPPNSRLAQLVPIHSADRALIGLLALQSQGTALRAVTRAANALAGPDSFAVLFDQHGIRITHTYDDDIVFHPAGVLDPETLHAQIAERRFGDRTGQLLNDVRAFPEQFARALAPFPNAEMFLGYAPVNARFNYGVARRLETAPWTLFYMVPAEFVNSRLSKLTRERLLFASAIMLAALFAGALLARLVLRPILELSHATVALAGGDLTARALLHQQGDEMGRLNGSFNAMAERIETRALALARARDDLEQRVQERTEQLLQATEDLKREALERHHFQQALSAKELEKQRGEAALQASQARLSALSDAGIIGIVVATLSGHIIEVNDALLDAIGYTRAEILSGSVSWRSLTPPEWRDSDDEARQSLTSTGVVPLRQKEYLHKSGRRVPVMVGSALLAATTDETISFVLDLTTNKQAALAIEQLGKVEASDAKFRGLLEAAPDAVVIVDAAGTLLLINAQTERLFGYSRGELLGRPLEVLVPERFRGRHGAHRAQYFSERQARAMGSHLELFGLRKDGTELPVEISLSPLETPEGLLVSAAIRDISERRKAEEHRFRLAAIVDSSADAIIGKTLTGIITSWNEGASRMFGYSAEEVIGQSVALLIPPGRESEEVAILARLGRGERVEQFDTIRRRKDGHDLHVSLTSSPVRDASGQLIGASKIVRDITERQRAEEGLSRARDAAEAATRELEAFSYSVAHDLRAPLRGMNGFAHILLSTYSDRLDAEGQDWLQEILLNARKMGELIDGLLSLARVTRSELTLERVNLSAIAREVTAQLAAVDPHRSVELTIEEQLEATMDPRLARVLLGNLLGNAWKFTSKAAAARVAFGKSEENGSPCYFVRDNGAGFDMKFAGKLFAPFQRLHTLAEYPGTGIGLATVQRIVHRHGGRIWAEAAVDAGAAFHFTLATRAPG